MFKEIINRLRGEPKIEQLKRDGMKVGKNFSCGSKVILDYAHCFLIEIGDNVTLAPKVHILAHDASTKKLIRIY